MRIKLEKLKELPDALHPNNIEVGYAIEGCFVEEPKVDECFWIGDFYWTSLVKEIIDENTFKTCNSVYRWTKID